MAQEDLVIANQTFPATRLDINANLQALGSLMSGASAPSTTYAYMWWADTTNGVLKQRDAANSAWVVRATLSDARVVSKTTTYAVVLGDFGKFIKADATSGAFSINLLAAATAGDGFVVTVMKTDSSVNAVTLDGNSSETIDGATTLVLRGQYDTVTLECDGSNWNVIAKGNTATDGRKGADVASATTTDLSTTTGQYVNITGTTTITGLGTAAAGVRRLVTFSGALTLTHNATSLILPGGANITTAAGDVFEFVSEGSGNWRCAVYTPAGGALSGMNLLSAQTASGSSALNFGTSIITSAYDEYIFELVNILPATDGALLLMNVGTGGTPTYVNGGADYDYASRSINSDGTDANRVGIGSSNGVIADNTNGWGNASGEAISGHLKLYAPASSLKKKMTFHVTGYDNQATARLMDIEGSCSTVASTVVTAFRFLFNSGNIASGTIRCYGIKK